MHPKSIVGDAMALVCFAYVADGSNALEIKSRESWNPAFYTRTRRSSMSELGSRSIASAHTHRYSSLCTQAGSHGASSTGEHDESGAALPEVSVVDELRRREVVDAEKSDTIWTGSSTIT